MVSDGWQVLVWAADLLIVGLGVLFAAVVFAAQARYREARFGLVGLAGVLIALAGLLDLLVPLYGSGYAAAYGGGTPLHAVAQLLLLGVLVALLLAVTLRRARTDPGT